METFQQKENKWLRKAVIIAAWLIIWQLVSMCVDNSILLVGPIETIAVLPAKMAEVSFWQTIFFSLLRILAGFLAGWILGLLLAASGAGCEWVEEALRLVMTLMKTVPVASFVVLFLIWFRTDILAVVISLCVVLPNVYLNTLEGIKSTDGKLLEMAKVHRLHPLDRFFYIDRPALKPFWDSCMKLSIGMSWKSGVAAEVIGMPDFSIGEQLYMSKIYLDTAGVLAWTAVIILLSTLCEKGFLKLWQSFMEWQPECRGAVENAIPNEGDKTIARGVLKEKAAEALEGQDSVSTTVLAVHNISKSYAANPLFDHMSAEYKKGRIYYFKTPSGSGKTTLFRMIAGLEKPDSGVIKAQTSLAFAFQEDRLCEDYSALKNVELITGSREKARRYLLPLLTQEELHRPCAQLSGGMKRRVAVARAFAAEHDIVLLDEPFAGLDEKNRKRMQEYIAEFGGDKAVLIATHM